MYYLLSSWEKLYQPQCVSDGLSTVLWFAWHSRTLQWPFLAQPRPWRTDSVVTQDEMQSSQQWHFNAAVFRGLNIDPEAFLKWKFCWALSYIFSNQALELVLTQEIPPLGLFSPCLFQIKPALCAQNKTACTMGAQTRTKKYWQQMGSPEWKRKPWAFHFLDWSLVMLRKEEIEKNCKLKRR